MGDHDLREVEQKVPGMGTEQQDEKSQLEPHMKQRVNQKWSELKFSKWHTYFFQEAFSKKKKCHQLGTQISETMEHIFHSGDYTPVLVPTI